MNILEQIDQGASEVFVTNVREGEFFYLSSQLISSLNKIIIIIIMMTCPVTVWIDECQTLLTSQLYFTYMFKHPRTNRTIFLIIIT